MCRHLLQGSELGFFYDVDGVSNPHPDAVRKSQGRVGRICKRVCTCHFQACLRSVLQGTESEKHRPYSVTGRE